jgi:hypothetical protein
MFAVWLSAGVRRLLPDWRRWFRARPGEPQRPAGGVGLVRSKDEVEALLDWLEANGSGGCHLCHVVGQGFIVASRED